MAKNAAQKDLFGNFMPEPEIITVEKQMEKPKPDTKARKQTVSSKTNKKNETKKETVSKPVKKETKQPTQKTINDVGKSEKPEKTEEKKSGRPKNEIEKKYKYLDITGLEDYVTVRARKKKMYISEYLRWLVMKDAKKNKDLFDMLVDESDERIKKELAQVEED